MERLNAESAVETAAIAGFFKLKSTQRQCGRTFLHSNNSTVVLNVKDDARFGQKTVSAHDYQCLVSNSIDNALLQWFELLLCTHSNILWPTP